MKPELTGKVDKPFDNPKWTFGGDVQTIWRRFGWTPPTEKRSDFKHTVQSTAAQQRLHHG